ncbi:MAG: hypothetical protein ACRD2H_12190 [Terriglobales bacterium]
MHWAIQVERMKGFTATWNEQFLPRVQALPGFVENIESLDPSTGKFCSVTLLQSSADEQRYAEGLYREIARAFRLAFKESPSVETLPVLNSSTQHVFAGRAVA